LKCNWYIEGTECRKIIEEQMVGMDLILFYFFTRNNIHDHNTNFGIPINVTFKSLILKL
jgi:hypothetical protein